MVLCVPNPVHFQARNALRTRHGRAAVRDPFLGPGTVAVSRHPGSETEPVVGPVGIPFRIQTLLIAVTDSVHSQVRGALWTRHGRAMGAPSFGIVEFLDLNATRLGIRNGPVPVRFCKKIQSPLNLQKAEAFVRK